MSMIDPFRPVIVEGPDGSGKTTLIQKSERNLMARHCDSSGPFKELAKWVEQDLDNPPPPNAIYDRYPLISEPIYGPIIRGTLPEGFNSGPWLKYCWRHLLAQTPLIIICLPPLETVITNVLGPDEQMSGVTSNITTIYWLYWAYAHQMRAQAPGIFSVYDYTRG